MFCVKYFFYFRKLWHSCNNEKTLICDNTWTAATKTHIYYWWGTLAMKDVLSMLRKYCLILIKNVTNILISLVVMLHNKLIIIVHFRGSISLMISRIKNYNKNKCNNVNDIASRINVKQKPYIKKIENNTTNRKMVVSPSFFPYFCKNNKKPN